MDTPKEYERTKKRKNQGTSPVMANINQQPNSKIVLIFGQNSEPNRQDVKAPDVANEV